MQSLKHGLDAKKGIKAKRNKTACLALAGVSLASVLSVGTPIASAQDLMPRDNGIFTYHEPPRWRESESHPLRVVAYATHWVGWTFREAIFRPFSSFAASTEFTRSFLGYREPFDYRESVCYSTSDEVPDCRKVLPYSNIAGYKGPEGEGSATGSMLGGDKQVYMPDVNFEFDKSNLTELGKGRVRQISQLLSSVPNLTIVVEGHADFMGSDEYNQSLGERRAQAVVDELVQLGVDPARLSPVSYGESKPIYTEEEDWARAVNRRVQFSVKGAAEAVASK